MNLSEKLRSEKLLPLYTSTDLDLLPLAENILLENGLSFIEVTYRSELAGKAIKYLADSGKLIVGAGTVTSVELAKDAVKNGAQFIVTPGFSDDIVEYCLEHDVNVYPGTVTPSEIMRAMSYGLDTIKFFPANIYGGLSAINALRGPFGEMNFIPTGGVNFENVNEFLENEAVLAVGGSFILSEDELKIDNGNSANVKLKALVNKIK